MKKQYLTLSDGTKVRIEANWNVLCDYLEYADQEFDQFAKEADKMTAKDMRHMAWCCAVEGERLEGNDLDLSEMQFGSLCTPGTMAEFGAKFALMIGDEQKKKDSPSEQGSHKAGNGQDKRDIQPLTVVYFRKVALGQIRMTPEQFYTIRLRYFFETLEGYFDRVNEDHKILALLIRRATTELWNTQVVKETERLMPEQLWPLPWDDDQDEIESDIPIEEIREHNKRLIGAIKAHKHG